MPTLSRPRQLRAIVGLSSLLLFLVGLAGCSKKVEQSEDIRPVRTLTLAPGSAEASMELSGEVVPRYESRLGFRVGGKIIARKVEVGSVVKRGQVLMQLDATDLQLSQAQAKAAVSGADSQLALAKADLERYRELRAKNFVSQAVLDAKEASYKAAQSAHDQASAGLKVQANQRSYTTLVADAEGVVTALDAEVGQVVAPGSPVVRLARTGAIEVKVSIPEDRVEAIRQAKSVTVRTWAQRDNAVPGVVREIAPAADPATRTFSARVALSKATADIRLGMTATVSFSAPLPPGIRVPLTALLNDQGKTSVWVVEKGKVKLVPIEVAGPQGNEILVASGLDAGQEVVIAGVHLLREGQKVSILGRPAVAAGAPQ
ncbi:MAG: efflux RND transporter periplasmic adaptor subunit [Betaproteobacteria bacterium]